MFARMAVLIAVVNRPLLAAAWPPIAVMGAVTAAFALWHYRAGLAETRRESRPLGVQNPFSLSAAVRFGALFAVVLLVVKLAQQHAPQQAVYVVAALAGSVDVDAITCWRQACWRWPRCDGALTRLGQRAQLDERQPRHHRIVQRIVRVAQRQLELLHHRREAQVDACRRARAQAVGGSCQS